ncbi:MAG TPA: hypothetical protein VIE86_03500 [Nitrososphaera sp.]|jgi:hypothetical protein
MMILSRPMEVMIIVGLNGAIGAILLMNGLTSAGGIPEVSFNSPGVSVLFGILSIAGLLKIPIGIGFLGSAAGLFLGKGWGWSLARTLQFAGIALGFAFLYTSGGEVGTMLMYVLGMALSGVILGFLHTAEMREFYGKQMTAIVPQRKLPRKKRKSLPAEVEDDETSTAEVE